MKETRLKALKRIIKIFEKYDVRVARGFGRLWRCVAIAMIFTERPPKPNLRISYRVVGEVLEWKLSSNIDLGDLFSNLVHIVQQRMKVTRR